MVRCAFGYMLETLRIHRYSPVRAVKIRVVQAISREVRCSKEHDPSETTRRTSTKWTMIWSHLHGDMQGRWDKATVRLTIVRQDR